MVAEEQLRLEYDQATELIRTLTDARFKLLALVPTIAGAAVDGWLVGGLRLLPFIAVGAVLAVAYNLEWFGGVVHNGVGLAVSWGAFPVLTSYYAQRWSISVAAVAVGLGAAGLAWAQRTLSTPARWLRRSVTEVNLTATDADGSPVVLRSADLLRPLEVALRTISWSLVVVAIGLVVAAYANGHAAG